MTKKTAREAVALTARQSRFVDEYLLEPNATQAYIRSGYSPKGANTAAARLLANVRIQTAIQQRMDERSRRTQVDADYVLHRLHDIDQLDIIDILDDAGNVRPVKEWPKEWRQSITAADLHEMQVGDVMTVVRKIKWPDKLKTLELIGKHVSVRAFEEDKGAGSDDLATALSQLAEKLPG
ncbi:terminase small subunit [Halomonas sp. V046]|uniref:terminase small subunit n=1 Tax=Halomonas sp. V046 TaxID=3459611 RepID=UPI004044FF5F